MLTKFPSYYVMAANTGIGKTIFSTGIIAAAVRESLQLLYLKPQSLHKIQTLHQLLMLQDLVQFLLKIQSIIYHCQITIL